jgi:pyruvate kinase
VKRQRHARILATIGPASATKEMLRKLHLAGADTFRLNFSHGRHEDHASVYHAIRSLEQEFGAPIGILQDLQGPKIRIGDLGDRKIAVEAGELVQFSLSRELGQDGAIPIPHPEVFKAVDPGHKLMIDDGRVCVVAENCGDDAITGRAVNAGTIQSRKGINLPNSLIQISPLTDKDRRDLAFGMDLGVDWVALSFVQRPSDMIEARGLIGDRAGLVAKIEKPQALATLGDIVLLSDAVMIARGDLGVEIPPEDVPARQKDIIRICRKAVKPVIVATQMLESMTAAPTPTRAEASDVATAIYDGADVVMLSAESATGRYPLEAVEMMDKIIKRTEADRSYRSVIAALGPDVEMTPPHAVAAAAADLAGNLDASAIVTLTASGVTALRISRKRPAAPILALTPDVAVARRLCLAWGVESRQAPDAADYDQMVELARTFTAELGLHAPARNMVIVAGLPFGSSGHTNNIRIV